MREGQEQHGTCADSYNFDSYQSEVMSWGNKKNPSGERDEGNYVFIILPKEVIVMEYIKTEDLAKHQRECDCGFTIEVKPGYNICTKSLTKQQKPQAQAQKPAWFIRRKNFGF